MEITFSIILPVRNGGAFVKECIQSILKQTYTNFNLVILDNNSTDGTTEYIQSLRDSRILHDRSHRDLSMPDNWRRSLFLPLNKYITFIGHDDILYANYLTEMHRLISRFPDASIYQTHFNFIDRAGTVIRSCKLIPEKVTAADYLRGEFLQTMDSMGTGFLFKAADFKKLGGYDYEIPNLIFSDYKLYTQLSGLAYQAVSSTTCFAYRVHNSLSVSTDIDQYRKAFEMYMEFLRSYQKENPSIQKVIEEDAPAFLQFYCRSLSHRLVKSKTDVRIKVNEFVNDCRKYAEWLGIAEKFSPYYNDPSILVASLIDSNKVTRGIYRCLRN